MKFNPFHGPSVTQVLRETLSHGAAAFIGNAISQSGVHASPEVINDTVEFFEDNDQEIKKGSIACRKEITRHFVVERFSNEAEKLNGFIALYSDETFIEVTRSIDETMKFLDKSSSNWYSCCSSTNSKSASSEAKEFLKLKLKSA